MESLTTDLVTMDRGRFARRASAWAQTVMKAGSQFLKSVGWSRGIALALVLGSATYAGWEFSHTIQTMPTVYNVYVRGVYEGAIQADSPSVQRLSDFAYSFDIPLTMVPVHQKASVTSAATMQEILRRVAHLDGHGVEIDLNGKPIGTVASMGQAKAMVAELKQKLAPKMGKILSEEVQLKDQLTYLAKDVSSSALEDPDAVVKYLLTGGHTPQTYRVSRGDTLSAIAEDHKVSVDALTAANPELKNPDALNLGQTINLTTPVPIVKYDVTVVEQKNVSIPFSIQYKDDSSLGVGDVEVVTPGVDGHETQTVQITTENGQVVSQKVLAQSVISQPVTEIARRGTNDGIASGAYIWPATSYVITSPYGEWRGNERHPGVDIGASYGSPIFASNNGRIIEAGWDTGGYGNCVRIDHGTGVISIYGHMSQVLVHVGDIVHKGQEIGLVGATGEATGPHLHYEVHVNGVRVNPAPYM